MSIEIHGKVIETDTEGYLVDPTDWDETVASVLAREEKLELSARHWKVIRFMRKYYDEHQIAADARFVKRHLAEELGDGKKASSHLFELFPYGYVQQACKIAGMKRPRAWSTG